MTAVPAPHAVRLRSLPAPRGWRAPVASAAAFVLAWGFFLAIHLMAPRAASAATQALADPQRLEVPGFSDAFFYRPVGKGTKPIVMYLHGRGGNPEEDCRKWAKVASPIGWVVCPAGPEDRGGGSHTWMNNPQLAKQVIDATVKALRAKYKSRVKATGNILVGFSEGAFVAMQVGVHDPVAWNRWLILAANDQYWFGDAKSLLEENRKKIRRVYLLTGETDMVASNTERAGEMLKDAKISVKVRIVGGMGHEVPSDRMITNYRRPLLWLSSAK